MEEQGQKLCFVSVIFLQSSLRLRCGYTVDQMEGNWIN